MFGFARALSPGMGHMPDGRLKSGRGMRDSAGFFRIYPRGMGLLIMLDVRVKGDWIIGEGRLSCTCNYAVNRFVVSFCQVLNNSPRKSRWKGGGFPSFRPGRNGGLEDRRDPLGSSQHGPFQPCPGRGARQHKGTSRKLRKGVCLYLFLMLVVLLHLACKPTCRIERSEKSHATRSKGAKIRKISEATAAGRGKAERSYSAPSRSARLGGPFPRPPLPGLNGRILHEPAIPHAGRDRALGIKKTTPDVFLFSGNNISRDGRCLSRSHQPEVWPLSSILPPAHPHFHTRIY